MFRNLCAGLNFARNDPIHSFVMENCKRYGRRLKRRTKNAAVRQSAVFPLTLVDVLCRIKL